MENFNKADFLALTERQRIAWMNGAIGTLQKSLRDEIQTLSRIVSELNATTSTDAGFYETLLTAAKVQYARIMSIWQGTSKDLIQAAFFHQDAIGKNILRMYGIGDASAFEADGSAVQYNAIEALVRSTDAFMAKAASSGAAAMEQFIRATQQQVLAEAEINQAIIKGLLEKGTSRAIKSDLLISFQQRFGNGQFLDINGRQYDIKSYVDLLARTRIREAQREANRSLVRSNGLDLIKISSHGTLTRICQPHEGKIYSVSGLSRKYPPASELPNGGPPFHPNCLHSEIPYVEKAIISDSKLRQIEKYVDKINALDQALS